jgi:hypothetical protein
MANGRCHWHGGKTPKAAGWHKPRWPDGNAANYGAKLHRKLKDRERQAKRREQCLAAMTPEERERHEAWQRAHKPGAAATRAQDRFWRAQNASARERMAQAAEPRPASPEAQEIAAKLRDIEALRETLAPELARLDLDEANLPTEGVFG